MPSFLHNKTGAAIVALLAVLIVSQGYLFYRLYGQGALSSGQPPIAGAGIPAGSGEMVAGPSAGTGIETVYGTVASAGSGSVVVNMDGTQKTLAVGSQTSVFLQGKQKRPGDFQKDIEAYNKQYAELLKDREANSAAIQRLQQPDYFSMSPILVSDLHAGDEVTASVFGGATLRIIKLPTGTLTSDR